MSFKLACGDVMPGCVATFENEDMDGLMSQVADHAAHDHGLLQLDDATVAHVQSFVVSS